MIKPAPHQVLHDFSFLDDPSSSHKPIAVLIILNQPVLPEQFISLRKHSRFLLFADGGSNRIYDTLLRSNSDALPDAIIGDLDSIRQEVLEFYLSKGAKECRIKCQDSTDFEKAFHYGMKMMKDNELQNEEEGAHQRPIICFLGAFGGRIDQTLSSIHNTVKFINSHPQFEIMLCDSNSLMIPLVPTIPDFSDISPKQAKLVHSFHRIVTSTKYELEDGCGLLPIHIPQRFIVSQGLKWDLGEQISTLKFGEFISSSNMRLKAEVKVWNSDLIFWSSSLVFKKHENFKEDRITQ